MTKLFAFVLLSSLAHAANLEDPATQCAKQPAEKMMMLVDKYGAACPALRYFKQSMSPKEAYFTWCTQVVNSMNQLQIAKSSMMDEIYEKKREPLVQQKMHLNSLVNNLAANVDKLCADEVGAKSSSGAGS